MSNEEKQRGRPQFDSIFEYNRVSIGEVIPSSELGRRLCYELQIPQRFSVRVYKALSRAMADAIKHGEGIRFQNFGTLKLKKYNTDSVKMPNGEYVPRPAMYKIVFETAPAGLMLLQTLTKQLRESGGEDGSKV